MYFIDLILKSTNTLKTTWNIVRTATNKQTATNNATTINASNTLVTNPVTIADAFNDYFSSVAENLVKNLPRKHNIADTDPLTYLQHNYSKPNVTIRLKSTTTREIDKIVHSLQSTDSHGYDEVSTRIVKISAPYILSPLILILNKIL